jgi:hypothetical protein
MPINIGRHNDVPDSAFDPEELRLGIEVEMEHTDDPIIAKAIAKDHLSEIPNYYSLLLVMEKEHHVEARMLIRASLRVSSDFTVAKINLEDAVISLIGEVHGWTRDGTVYNLGLQSIDGVEVLKKMLNQLIGYGIAAYQVKSPHLLVHVVTSQIQDFMVDVGYADQRYTVADAARDIRSGFLAILRAMFRNNKISYQDFWPTR